MLLLVRFRWFLLLFLGLSALPAAAQVEVPFGFEQRAVAKVTHDSQTLSNPWAGGLNSPQFSAIDLNSDGQQDLYLFDRQTSRSLTYLNVAGANGGRAWQYAPEYEALFPTGLLNWVLLRDYDCDNRPDIFTFANGGDVRVFRNVAGAGGRPTFELVIDQLSFFNTTVNSGNIVTGGSNLPAIQDVNGDGRLDILTYDFGSSSRVELYLNTASTCGGLQFRQETSRWGNFSVCLPGCTSFAFGADACSGGKTTHTSGSTLLALDLDGDNDLDILTARDGCPDLVSLTNLGTTQAANITAASLDATFPDPTAPVRITNFPAGYYLDVTFDGRPDLLAAPALFDNQDRVSTAQSVRLYENTGSASVPRFTLRSSDFLQADMVEVSEAAAPAIGDLDGDGLPDMLVAGSDARAAGYSAFIHYYRNIGTAAQPNFQRVSDDYLGLSTKKYTGLKPILVDLNRDGALDIAFSATTGATSQVLYLLNQAPAGRPAVFDGSQPVALANLPNRADDAPCFTDVDGDGNVDLLLGTNVNTASGGSPRYSVQYYRHNGGTSSLAQAFELVTTSFGQIQSAAGNLHPTVADLDGDGRPDLLTADANGELRLYADFRTQLLTPTTPFNSRNNLLYNTLLNEYRPTRLGVQRGSEARNRVAPVAADLDGNGTPELLVGLESGGIVSFAARGRVLSANPAAEVALGLQVYPNPATTSTLVEAAQPVRLTLLDLTGRRIRTFAEPARRHILDLRGLTAGVYLIRAESITGEAILVRRILVR